MDWCVSSFPAQEWLVNEEQLDVFGMKLPTGFQLIGQVVRILPPHCTMLLQPSLETETETKWVWALENNGVLHLLLLLVDW